LPDRSTQPCAACLPATLLVLLLAAAAGTIVLFGAALISNDPGGMNFLNGSLPALLGGTCLWAGYRLVRKQPAAVWAPLPWFLATWAAYYGFGALANIYATPETIAHMAAFYPVDNRSLLRTNLLNVVGLVTVLLGAALVSRLRFGFPRPMTRSPSHDAWRVAVLFLVIGVPIKYLLELPYVLGLVDFVLPGSIQYLGTFSGLAILPLTVAAAEGRRGARTLLWTLVASEMLAGFVMLAKLHIITTVLLVFLGQYAVRPDLKRLVVTGILVGVGYVAVLSPFVDFARTILGRASARDLAEVSAVAGSYGTEGRETLADVLPGVQGWWSRLAYSNAQAFAMDQYDQGKAGWTFGMAGYVFVPRFLYDDKPIMTPGKEFTYLVQGTDTSSTGPGFFIGEAYWNGGWPLVILTGLFVGGLFAVLGRISARAVRAGRWLYVPLVFMTIYLGLRPDDWFVPLYLGGVMQVVLVVILLNLTLSALVLRRGKRPSDGRQNPRHMAAGVPAADAQR